MELVQHPINALVTLVTLVLNAKLISVTVYYTITRMCVRKTDRVLRQMVVLVNNTFMETHVTCTIVITYHSTPVRSVLRTVRASRPILVLVNLVSTLVAANCIIVAGFHIMTLECVHRVTGRV